MAMWRFDRANVDATVDAPWKAGAVALVVEKRWIESVGIKIGIPGEVCERVFAVVISVFRFVVCLLLR